MGGAVCMVMHGYLLLSLFVPNQFLLPRLTFCLRHWCIVRVHVPVCLHKLVFHFYNDLGDNTGFSRQQGF